jgi:hypothetical protein
MTPGDLFTSNALNGGTHWIFLSETDLAAIEREFQREADEPKSSSRIDFFISLRLRCALETARGMKIKDGSMPKLAVIMAEIPKYWRGTDPLSKNAVLSIARLIRDEDSRAGRGSKADKARNGASMV